MELVGTARRLVLMDNRAGSHLEFTIPAAGLIGLRKRMPPRRRHSVSPNFHDRPRRGDVPVRSNGVMFSTPRSSNAYAMKPSLSAHFSRST